MRTRVFETLFVLALVALVSTIFRGSRPETAPEPAPPVAPSSAGSPRGGPLKLVEAVPGFTLQQADGQRATYEQGQGPLLVVLTATGCGGCLQRIDGADRSAYDLANKVGIPVWNTLVYERNGADFLSRHKPSADRILCDPDASISVATLGGSDATCWLLIDKQGRLAWRGPAEPDRLQAALQSADLAP